MAKKVKIDVPSLAGDLNDLLCSTLKIEKVIELSSEETEKYETEILRLLKEKQPISPESIAMADCFLSRVIDFCSKKINESNTEDHKNFVYFLTNRAIESKLWLLKVCILKKDNYYVPIDCTLPTGYATFNAKTYKLPGFDKIQNSNKSNESYIGLFYFLKRVTKLSAALLRQVTPTLKYYPIDYYALTEHFEDAADRHVNELEELMKKASVKK